MTLTQEEAVEASLVLQFMNICSQGLIRPYDPTPIIEKLGELRLKGYDTSQFEMCCPPVGDIRDVKDLKPYIMGCAERLSKILGIEPVYKDQHRGDDRRRY